MEKSIFLKIICQHLIIETYLDYGLEYDVFTQKKPLTAKLEELYRLQLLLQIMNNASNHVKTVWFILKSNNIPQKYLTSDGNI